MKCREDQVRTERYYRTLINQLDITVGKLESDRREKLEQEEETETYDPCEAHLSESFELPGLHEIVLAFNPRYAVNENRLDYLKMKANELYANPSTGELDRYSKYEGLNWAILSLHDTYAGTCTCSKCGKHMRCGDTTMGVCVPYDETVNFTYCEDCADKQLREWEKDLYEGLADYAEEVQEVIAETQEACAKLRADIVPD